jgi:ribulose-phosphate 3-epimerase
MTSATIFSPNSLSAEVTQPLVIAPSMLSADFSRLAEEAEAIALAGADWFRLDIMDGHFVPNISFGPDVVRALRPHSDRIFDMHLMIAPVDPYLEAFAKAAADYTPVHADAGPHLDRFLQVIRSLGKKAGIPSAPQHRKASSSTFLKKWIWFWS